METIFIPRDPRSDNVKFIEKRPKILEQRITEDFWTKIIGFLNEFIKYSYIRSLRNKKIRKYLYRLNKILLIKKIFICDPSVNNFLELKIILY
ncbi:hypothetical protein SLOPH_2402 [Spraguea lophii 42_110]|uniref:Uncharacterized protein n=1 Tax=Spraguea lophii (strain 42_110) TaxID=1358809 RepID=S7XUI6_SPRLO|nr:hypothetical protein SLOPH_2402 [Spraguea lophii 42_110]